MKKIISVIICLILAICMVSCGGKNYIEVSKVKETVAKDVGAAVNDIEFIAHDLVTEDKNGEYYDVKFKYDGTEYTYKVDAMSGNIIEKDSEFKDTDDNSDVTTTEGMIESFVDDMMGDDTSSNNNNNNNNDGSISTTNTTTL